MSINHPIEWLKVEHEAIKLRLRILEEVSKKLESGENVNPEHIKQTVHFKLLEDLKRIYLEISE